MTEIQIKGMTCEHCANAVREALGDVDGVTAVTEVNVEGGFVTVEGEAGKRELVKAVKQLGYKAKVKKA